MKIHPLWFVCIITRLCLILFIRYINNNKQKKYINLLTILLFLIGLGFLYKHIFGSNNEIQLARVFWHQTRFTHSYFYILSAIYLYFDKINMNSIILITDLLYSITYRLVSGN